MNQVLVLGSSGQLGRELSQVLMPNVNLDHRQFALFDVHAASDFLKSNKIKILVNTIGYTDVDGAESDIAEAESLNIELPEVWAEACYESGARLIQFSTDYVFGGGHSQPIAESDFPRPLSVYGRTKLEGEKRVLMYRGNLVFRTSWLYSQFRKNFLLTMLRLAHTENEVKVVDDVLGCPTSTKVVARVLKKIIDQLNGGRSIEAGIYHLCCSGLTSWAGFAREIFSRTSDLMPDFRSPNIVSITTAKSGRRAQRPSYSVLCTKKIEDISEETMPEWKQALHEVLDKKFLLAYFESIGAKTSK